MAMDPLQFLDIARHLVKSEASECNIRSAINRSYYSMFLIARDKCGVLTETDVHSETIKAVTLKAGWPLGNALGKFRKLRVKADYQLAIEQSPADWNEDWNVACECVEFLQDELLKL